MLSVRNLSASFHTRAGIVRAVRNVSFDVAPGETLGIVGESGSGKSVTCYSMMGLIPMPPGRIESGSAMLDGTDLLHCPEKELRSIRGKRVYLAEYKRYVEQTVIYDKAYHIIMALSLIHI